MFDIQEELGKLPKSPGVYIMKDQNDTVIYVGKAKNLRNRVRNYFQPANANMYKLDVMVPLIRSFEYIVTDTEVEALILENNLIKKYWPKFNVRLKDDKTYPYIKVTLEDDFPQVLMVREFIKDKSRYFGPFTNSYAVMEIIELTKQIWKFRLCNKNIQKNETNGRPCLNYHIGQCCGPCAGLVTHEDYMKMIAEAISFLEGKDNGIVARLEKSMMEYSENMEYEKAQEVKNKILAIRRIKEKQKLDALSDDNQDVMAVAKEGGDALVQVFFIRSGKLMGREHFMLEGVSELEISEILGKFITQYYSGTPFIPREIFIETEIPDLALITEWLSIERGSKVTISIPKRGDKLKLLNLASKNALLTLSQSGERLKREKQRKEGAAAEIAAALGLPPLKRVEIYDISNIQGYESVASMVVYENGEPKRNDYRKFKIKSVTGANDYASMEEVIRRRFSHYFKEADEAGKIETETERKKYLDSAKFSILPDLICIDGGKGQVSAASDAMQNLGITIPCCGLVKDDNHRTRGIMYKDSEITLPRTSEGFKLLTRMQDEVHRFAVEYHRKLRQKKLTKSALDDIKGIGKSRKKELFKKFGSVDKIRYATVNELCETPLMNKRAAQSVYDFFRSDND